MSYIKRDMEQTIMQHISMPEIIAILGPCQSGKTTLMKHIFDTLEKGVFLSFEDRKTLELFVEDEKTFAELLLEGYLNSIFIRFLLKNS
jgi:hypothetical protein